LDRQRFSSQMRWLDTKANPSNPSNVTTKEANDEAPEIANRLLVDTSTVAHLLSLSRTTPKKLTRLGRRVSTLVYLPCCRRSNAFCCVLVRERFHALLLSATRWRPAGVALGGVRDLFEWAKEGCPATPARGASYQPTSVRQLVL
jgi:hypothetical protein